NVQPQNGGQVQANNILWNVVTTPQLASIPPGAFVNLVFTAEVAPGTASGTLISNQATIVGEDGQALLTDDPGTPAVDDPTTILVRYPQLEIFDKFVEDINGGAVEPGDQLRYSILLVGGPDEPIIDVTVTDALDPNVVLETIENGGTQGP